MSTYNGYTNYATWNVCLWIDNEEDMYRHKLDSICQAFKRSLTDSISASQAREIAIDCLGEESTPDLENSEGFRWEDVNWDEIANEWTIKAKEALDRKRI